MDYSQFNRSDDVEDRRGEALKPGVFSEYDPTDLGGDNIFWRGNLTGLDLRQMPATPWNPAGAALGLGSLGVNRGDIINSFPSGPTTPLSFASPSVTSSIINAESGGDPNARNPNSSASGPGQFIDSTFLDVARKLRPDLADRPDSEVLAMKTDPDFARQATEAYAQQNQANLAKNGLPVTPGNTYLAHFAGPQGAVKVLQADPNTPVGDILGASVVAANPFLQGMTAQGLQAWAAKKMGATLPQPGVQNNAPVNSPSPQAATVAPPMAAPIFPAQPQATPQAAPEAPSPVAQIPDMQAPPIFFQQRRPVNMTALRGAFHAPVFPRG